MRAGPIIGVLLAAGSASRFGGGKLLAALPDGTPIGLAALQGLAGAVDGVVAVVRPRDDALAAAMAARGARITECPHAADGIGASLAWGVRATPVAAAWLIALADMPWVQPATLNAVVNALRGGASIAAPSHLGTRGHPVGFAAELYAELIALSGDEGAKSILGRHSPVLIETLDAGVLRDVDTRQDLGA